MNIPVIIEDADFIRHFYDKRVIPEIFYRGSIAITLDSRLKPAGVTNKCSPASSSN